jgi:hypothetical protein
MAAVCLAVLVGARAAGWPWQTVVFTTQALGPVELGLVLVASTAAFVALELEKWGSSAASVGRSGSAG